MDDLPLNRTAPKSLLHHEEDWLYLPARIAPEQLVLCLGRVFQTFNRPPPLMESVSRINIPFWVFQHDDSTHMVPAAGLPYRLLESYQYVISASVSVHQGNDQFTNLNPDVSYDVAVTKVSAEFFDNPGSVDVRIVFIPFYIISTQWGVRTVPVLLNACNADALLENPPTKVDSSAAARHLFLAISAYSGLVIALTSTWIASGSMGLTLVMSGLSVFGIRWLIIRGIKEP